MRAEQIACAEVSCALLGCGLPTPTPYSVPQPGPGALGKNNVLGQDVPLLGCSFSSPQNSFPFRSDFLETSVHGHDHGACWWRVATPTHGHVPGAQLWVWARLTPHHSRQSDRTPTTSKPYEGGQDVDSGARLLMSKPRSLSGNPPVS